MNTAIPKKLKPFFLEELKEYKSEMQKDNLHKAWQHLEKAHVIGQAYPYEHSYVHWKMLLFGIHIKNGKEILGQIPRLVFGGVKSFVGTIPVGNTGGANVPPLRPLPISKEIQSIFEKTGVKR